MPLGGIIEQGNNKKFDFVNCDSPFDDIDDTELQI